MTVFSILAVAGVVWLTGVIGTDDPVAGGVPSTTRKTTQPDMASGDASNRSSMANTDDSETNRVRKNDVSADRAASVQRSTNHVSATNPSTVTNERALVGGPIVKRKGHKPMLPSGGIRITTTTYDSAETAQMEAAERARNLANDNGGADNDKSLDIRALGYIQLTTDEASGLGLTVTREGLNFLADDFSELRYARPTDRSKFVTRSGKEVFLKRFAYNAGFQSGFGRVELPANTKPLDVAPVVIVAQYRVGVSEGSFLTYFEDAPTLDRLGNFEASRNITPEFYSASSADSAVEVRDRVRKHPLLGRLVPVYFWIDGGVSSVTTLKQGAEVCLWYAPTPEFIAALPERYRSALEGEVKAIEQIARVDGSVEQVCDKIAGKPSYLEVCRMSSGAITGAVVNPNPASDQASLSFALKEDRIVSVTLHDLSGRYLRHMSQGEALTTGDHAQSLDLTQLNQGAYLVAVRTERGEQAVARLIVQ